MMLLADASLPRLYHQHCYRVPAFGYTKGAVKRPVPIAWCERHVWFARLTWHISSGNLLLSILQGLLQQYYAGSDSRFRFKVVRELMNRMTHYVVFPYVLLSRIS